MVGSRWTLDLIGLAHEFVFLMRCLFKGVIKIPDIASLKYASCCYVHLRNLLWPKLVLKRLSVHPGQIIVTCSAAGLLPSHYRLSRCVT